MKLFLQLRICRAALLCLLTLIGTSFVAGQASAQQADTLAYYTFTGSSPFEATEANPVLTVSPFSSSRPISIGSENGSEWAGPLPYAQSNGGWNSDTLNGSSNSFNFLVESQNNDLFTLENISFQIRRNSAGPKNIAIIINGSTVKEINNIPLDEVITINEEISGSSFTNINDAFIQISGWDGSGSFAEGTLQINDVLLEGTILQEAYAAQLSGNEGWRFLTSPVQGSTWADLFSNVWTQGIPNSQDPPPTDFDSNLIVLNDEGEYIDLDDLADTIVPGSAVGIYIYEDDDPLSSGVQGGFPKNLFVQGTANSGNISPDIFNGIENGEVYTLVGNPYPERIEFGELTKSNIGGVVYVYDHFNNSFKSWSLAGNGSGDLSNGILSPFQGFFVFAENEGSASLEFTEDAVTTVEGIGLQRDVPTDALRINAVSGQGASGGAWLSANDKGTTGFGSYDAPYIYPIGHAPFMAIFTEAGGRGLQINNIPDELAEAFSLPLTVQPWEPSGAGFAPSSGQVTLEWTVGVGLPVSWQILLEDSHTGHTYDLSTPGGFTFTLDPVSGRGVHMEHSLSLRTARSESLKGSASRFMIRIDPQPTSSPVEGELPVSLELMQNYPNPFNPATAISYQLPAASDVSLDVFNIQGQRVATLVRESQQAGEHTVSFDASSLASGVYIYRLQAGSEVRTRRMTLIK